MKLHYHPQIHSFEIGCPRGRLEDLQGGKMKYSYHTGSQSWSSICFLISDNSAQFLLSDGREAGILSFLRRPGHWGGRDIVGIEPVWRGFCGKELWLKWKSQLLDHKEGFQEAKKPAGTHVSLET